MKKILTVIGARPQFVKAAAISRAIQLHFQDALQEVIVHTGQHYDDNMSKVFFDELKIPKPYVNLEIGGIANQEQIEKMQSALREVMQETNPNVVLVYGDTNSTHAAALVASEENIPLVHVEAGLRSFNLAMPEEINRIVADKNSTLMFVPTEQGLKNLAAEGFSLENKQPFTHLRPGIFHCGDVMYDNAIYFSEIAAKSSEILARCGVQMGKYLLVTIHRDNNTDNTERLSNIFQALIEIAENNVLPIILPLHPRTKKMMEQLSESLKEQIKGCSYIKLIPPVSYLDMIQLESNAQLILTDSGGVQKEAFFFKKPCVILRSETEWTELVENGNALIADADTKRIISAFDELNKRKNFTWPAFYGDANAARFICETIISSIA